MPIQFLAKLSDNIKTFYSKNILRGRLLLALLIFVFILILVRLTLPHAIIYNANSWLKKQGIESSIEALNINLFDGSFSLLSAKGYKNNNLLFNIGLVDVHWSWTPLSKKIIEITGVTLDKISVNIEQYTDMIIIGGVQIDADKKAEKSDPSPEKNTASWAASIGEVLFKDFNICYLQHSIKQQDANDATKLLDYCASLKEMSWGGTLSYATDHTLPEKSGLPLTSTGNFKLNGLTVTDNRLNKVLLSSETNTLDNVVISGLNSIQIDSLSMYGLSALQRDDAKHPDSVRFEQLTINNINLLSLNNLELDSLSIKKPGLYLVKDNTADWEYQQWIPVFPHSNSSGPETQNKKTSVFKFALNNITIGKADSCYLENNTSLYYCFTFEELDWVGALKYTSGTTAAGSPGLAATGDLALSQPEIHNHTIDKNLVKLKALSLNGVNLTDINSLSLDNLTIDSFSALQRSKTENDSTLSFDKLDINTVAYSTSSISIDSIRLDGLTGKVSRNKDNSWEHDKWLLSKADHNTKAGARKNTGTQSKQTLAINLNTFTLTSNREISFIDNSTTPVMKVGLIKLSLDLSNINSDQPQADSLIKLFAKTSRHGTIDIEGTAKPFAEKISIDANGKLSGFDLRAASPASQKAIGHIIKSGQMDADLRLLAVDGELDSNIALSLYHFNIQSMDKESAENLDKRFGMPLNQTLVLLRDKDDSIHLDIPITGDVTNPDFNPMDAIVKATSKAATVTLITFYTPYGLVYAGGNVLFDLATALNFEPVIFDPGKSELKEENKQQLGKLTELLTQKPGIHLTLCGMTNRSDLFALFPGLKKESDIKDADLKLSKKQQDTLKELASQRQINSKEYLINQLNVSHDRLILCAPEYNTQDDAIAGVEINI